MVGAGLGLAELSATYWNGRNRRDFAPYSPDTEIAPAVAEAPIPPAPVEPALPPGKEVYERFKKIEFD